MNVTPQKSNDDYEFTCDACGDPSDKPMPFAEAMTLPGSFFYYCEKCAGLDGAAIVPTMAEMVGIGR